MLEQVKKCRSASEAKLHFGEILNECIFAKTPVYIQRHGKPVAVLVSIDAWEGEVVIQRSEPPLLKEFRALWEMQAAFSKKTARRGRVPTNSELLREARNERDKELLKKG